jgi:arylsulfatase
LRSSLPAASTALILLLSACDGEPPPTPEAPPSAPRAAEPTFVSLSERFASARVENPVAPKPVDSQPQWRFDDGDGDHGWEALHGVTDLGVRDGRLSGRTTELPLLVAAAPELDPGDLLHAIEIRIRVSAGSRIGIDLDGAAEIDRKLLLALARDNLQSMLSTELIAGDEIHTYTLTTADSRFDASFPLSNARRIVLRPTDVAGASFELESVRLVSRKEHLASIPSGLGWHGLRDVYRETIVARAPERIAFELTLPSAPRLELFLGTIDDGPVTFEAAIAEPGAAPTRLLRRTLSTPLRWERADVDLRDFAGRSATLLLSLEALEPGAIGFWGGPALRNRAGSPVTGASSPSRSALADAADAAPNGVILILADTLRRDHLQPYGHERPNAPVLSRLASEGALFRDAISQGTWTKVASTSILTSLYPSTHGVTDMPDRIPATITTLAEAYREAGYATFATSSVPFTGKLTNLQQGVDVLHERASVEEIGQASAKTARVFTDRLLTWLDERDGAPFFAFLHVFDPHSPFEPQPPYERLWMEPDVIAEHRRDMETVAAAVENQFMKLQALPMQAEMDASGVDPGRYVEREKIWYDASIRAMDAEIGRLLERLEELGLGERTLIALVSDHGEEFLEHGRHFHGFTAYGEMINVPLLLWWPGVVPAATEVETTVQTIDLMPTLLELSRIAVPGAAQGQSLLPLLARGTSPAELGWEPRPAFSERALAPIAFSSIAAGRECRAVIENGWKLIHNTEGRPDLPEYELYDHRADPLDLVDVAAQHPDVVERLRPVLETWYESAVASRVEPADDAKMSPEEIQQLRALGYVQ